MEYLKIMCGGCVDGELDGNGWRSIKWIIWYLRCWSFHFWYQKS